jgi:putative flippase GtrA
VVFVGITSSLRARFARMLDEIMKFGAVGAAAFVIDAGGFNLLMDHGLNHKPLTAKAVSMSVAATFAYFANRHWTWKDKERQGLGREYSMFIALSVVGFALTEIPVGFSEYVLRLHSPLAYNISGLFVGTAVGTIWRFWSFKRWVFLEPEPQAADDAAREALV